MSCGHMCDFVGCRRKEQVEFSLCGLKSWCFDILAQLKLHFLPLKGQILPLILPCLWLHTQPPSRMSNCVFPLVWLLLLLTASLPSASIHAALSWGLKEVPTLAQWIRAWGTKKTGEGWNKCAEVSWLEGRVQVLRYFVLSHKCPFCIPFVSHASQLFWTVSVGYGNLDTSCRNSLWQAPGAREGQGENKLPCPVRVMSFPSEKATCWSLTHSTKKSRQISTWKIPGKWLSPETIAYFGLMTLLKTTDTLTQILPLMLWDQDQFWSKARGITPNVFTLRDILCFGL